MDAKRALTYRWLYRGVHLAIAAAGIAAIVGSGGGIGGFPSCDGSPLCQEYVTVRVEPAWQVAQVGQSVSFRAVTGGTVQPSSIQWSRCQYSPSGPTCEPLPGGGAYLTVNNVSLADDGATFAAKASPSGPLSTGSARLVVTTAAPVVFEDGEFLATDWVSSGFVGTSETPSSAFGVSQATAGGDPGAYRAIDYGPLSLGARMYVTHIAQAATYDPGQLGGIVAVYFRAACRAFVGDGRRMSARPLLRQGERTFISSLTHSQSCEGSGWRSDSDVTSLDANDFQTIFDGPACGEAETCPDFSAAGVPIMFGMLTTNTFVEPGATSTASHGVDNWRVSVWRH